MITPYFLEVYSNKLEIAPPVRRDTTLYPLFKANMVDILFAVDTNPYAKDKYTILQKFTSYADFCHSIFPFGDPPEKALPHEKPDQFDTRRKNFIASFEDYHAVLSPFTGALFADFSAYEKMIKSGQTPSAEHKKWRAEFAAFVEKTTLPHVNHLYRLDRHFMHKMGMTP
jgi:hypothetical protein